MLSSSTCKKIILDWSKFATYIVLHLSFPLTFFNDWTDCIARDRKSIKTKKQRTKRNNDSLHFSTSNIPRLLLGANSRCNYHGEFPLWSGWCARQYSEFKAVIKWSFCKMIWYLISTWDGVGISILFLSYGS